MLPPQLDTGAEGSQRSRAAEPSVLDNKSKGRTLIKAPQADAAEGMGGVAQTFLARAAGEGAVWEAQGGRAASCTPRGTEGLALDAATEGPGHPAGLWGCGGHSHGSASALGEPALCPAPTPGLWRELSKGAPPKVRLGCPASLSSGIPRICVCKGLCDPRIWAGGLEAAGIHQDSQGTSQGTIPGLQPSPKGTDTSPSKPCAQHQQKNPQIPVLSLAKREQSLSDCLLTSLKPNH